MKGGGGGPEILSYKGKIPVRTLIMGKIKVRTLMGK